MALNFTELDIHRRFMRPIRSKPFISIAIPTSITSDSSSKTLREQTLKIGYIGRAATIFRVEEIMVYNDGEGDAGLIEAILKYIEVPPYLKKMLVPFLPQLSFVSVVPPLKTPHHVKPDIFDTRYREGVVIERDENKCLVEIGLDKKGVIYGKCPPRGSRITVKIIRESLTYYHVVIVERAEVDIYWGYTTCMYESLKSLLNKAKLENYLIIVATKKGMPIHRVEENLSKEIKSKDKVLIIFGGPKLDVDEIASKEGFDIGGYGDFFINFVPKQGTVNIRTEEAIIATLAIINYIKGKYVEDKLT